MDRSVISCDEALRGLYRYDTIVDVRTPAEFALDHLPGAINCPVLSNEERIEIGTLHKQRSAFEAKRRGAALVARNIAAHLETVFGDKPANWKPLIYCWRGGQRSGAMTHICNRIGWHAQQLEGGYRAFRRAVVQALDLLPSQFEFRVICGPTGSGKSRLLQQLAAAGAQVLDLELLAQHRGSVLGGMPRLPQPSQKMFETRIWQVLRAFSASRPVFVESESRKVGNLRVPDRLIEHMRDACCLRLELALVERVKLLRAEYAHYENEPQELMSQLDCLRHLHGRERIEQWKQLIERQQWDAFVERLLVEHYDPAYQRSIERNFKQSNQGDALSVTDAAVASFAAIARPLAAGA